jgi:hypothetical protein
MSAIRSISGRPHNAFLVICSRLSLYACGSFAPSYAPALTVLLAFGELACGDIQTDLIVRETIDAASCTSDANCGGATPRCDTAASRCVACLETLDCDDDQVCALPAARCVSSCLVTGGCSDEQPVCDSAGICRGCEVDDECPSGAPRCNSDGACVECRAASDCAEEPDAPFCSASGECVECISDGHCDDEDERCSAVLGECATPCAESSGAETEGAGACSSDDPICDPDIGFCVECRSDEDCDSDERCLASECEDEDEDDDN